MLAYNTRESGDYDNICTDCSPLQCSRCDGIMHEYGHKIVVSSNSPLPGAYRVSSYYYVTKVLCDKCYETSKCAKCGLKKKYVNEHPEYLCITCDKDPPETVKILMDCMECGDEFFTEDYNINYCPKCDESAKKCYKCRNVFRGPPGRSVCNNCRETCKCCGTNPGLEEEGFHFCISCRDDYEEGICVKCRKSTDDLDIYSHCGACSSFGANVDRAYLCRDCGDKPIVTDGYCEECLKEKQF